MPLRNLGRLFGIALLAFACSPDTSSHPPARTQRERDSAIGASMLPGAGGVRGALRADDSAAARNARLDSIANPP
jgi:hypothetical protein